ncbi:YdgA family protein [Pseudomonas aegrilactucae]|uniref:YdgA family protein n=1 Tax=Pseudomonas aegrilactucae TaxID=2854028 RepID=A0A9Q2XKP2_9PSED|nr:YdgA family protein [Pseudomonas aegrilactucae]MBV6288463.1 YdgA family protein [Pseudomonas aegrilactucae]
MKKKLGVVCGLAVAVAAVCTAGAWYTGKQLPGVLEQGVAQSNLQMEKSLKSTGAAGRLELVSLEQHLFSSVARYKFTVNASSLGSDAGGINVTLVDHIEHGPFPWSRVKAFKLMPVMAASNTTIEKDASTAAWFALTGDASPLQGQFSMAYDQSYAGTIKVLPIEVAESKGSFKFAGFTLDMSGDFEGKRLKLDGKMGDILVTMIKPQEPPVKLEFKGANLLADLTLTPYDFYEGQADVTLGAMAFTFGPAQTALTIDGMEQRNTYKLTGDKLDAKSSYKVDQITYDNKVVGSGQVVMAFNRLDVPALQALMAVYEKHLPSLQMAAIIGETPQVKVTEEEAVLIRAEVLKLLAGKPQVALEDLSLKTANGESRFNLTLDLASPSSTDLPPDQIAREVVQKLQSSLLLSKPMIGDLAALQASVQGQGEAEVKQAAMAGEMVGQMALYSKLATLKGNDIIANLHYADGQVAFNGQKMTVEEFASLITSRLGGLQQASN